MGANSDDDLTLATQALVFMLVCVNNHFKVPIAYYFINSLHGTAKANILTNILCVLYEEQIDVRSITFDGLSSNITMCGILGAQLKHINIDEIVPYFTHPSDKSKRVYIFL